MSSDWIEPDPEYGPKLTQAVQRYADEHGLVADPWYHDSPIWYITDQVKVPHAAHGEVLDSTKRIQIGIAHGEGGLELHLIPSRGLHPNQEELERRKLDWAKLTKGDFEQTLYQEIGKVWQAIGSSERPQA